MKQFHILQADDDEFLIDLYKQLFEKEGYKVTNLSNLDKDFIEQVIKINPDLIISDNIKPNVTGMEFLRALKSDDRTKNIPFVFLSNSVESLGLVPEAKNLGVLACLTKVKLTPLELVEKIKGIINTLC
ncbi:MAG: response regulator [Candidatus Nomurabacteria bacterium]|nr:response regulator [Candidatus Nomurabacteria bacterium]